MGLDYSASVTLISWLIFSLTACYAFYIHNRTKRKASYRPSKIDIKALSLSNFRVLESSSKFFEKFLKWKTASDRYTFLYPLFTRKSPPFICLTPLYFRDEKIEHQFQHFLLTSNLLRLRILLLFTLFIQFFYDQYILLNTTKLDKGVRYGVALPITIISLFFSHESIFNRSHILASYSFALTCFFVGLMIQLIPIADGRNGLKSDVRYVMALLLVYFGGVMFASGNTWATKSIVCVTVALTFAVLLTSGEFTSLIKSDNLTIGNNTSMPEFQILFFILVQSVVILTAGYYYELSMREEFERKWKLEDDKIKLQNQLDSIKTFTNFEVLNNRDDLMDVEVNTPKEKCIRILEDLLGLSENPQYDVGIQNVIRILKISPDLSAINFQQDILHGEIIVTNRQENVLKHFFPHRNSSSLYSQKSNRDNQSSFIEENDRMSTLTHVDSASLKEIKAQLEKIQDWDFDLFKFGESSGESPIRLLMIEVIDALHIYDGVDIEQTKLQNFLKIADSTYCYDMNDPNPYHNNYHGADVLQNVYHFILQPKIQETFARVAEIRILALIVASGMHDFRHLGVSNSFLTRKSHELAITHNDSMVLERHHCAELFRILFKEEYNFIGRVPKDEICTFRMIVIDLILATDLSHGPKYLSDFSTILSLGEGFHEHSSIITLMQIIIKCADVAHPTKKIDLHLEWTNRITEEFFKQGDSERHLGLNISPLCDRYSHDYVNAQQGFINFVVNPLFRKFSAFCENNMWMTNLQKNYKYWSDIRHLDMIKEAKTSKTLQVDDNTENFKFLSFVNTKSKIDSKITYPPLLVFPGLGTIKEDYAEFTYELSLIREVIVVDPRLDSSLSNEKAIQHFVRDAIKLVDHLHHPVVDLLGICTGGLVAIEMASAHPRRIGKLILVNSFINGSILESIAHITKLEALEKSDDFLRKCFTKDWIMENKAKYDEYKSKWQERNQMMQMLPYYIQIFSTMNGSDKYAQLRCPILLLHGNNNEIVSVQNSLRLKSMNEHNVKYATLDKMGHFFFEMDEGKTAKAIDAFLKSGKMSISHI